MSDAEIIKNFIVRDIITDAAKSNIKYEDSLLEAGVIDTHLFSGPLEHVDYPQEHPRIRNGVS